MNEVRICMRRGDDVAWERMGDVFFDMISGVAGGEAPVSPIMAGKMLADFSGRSDGARGSGGGAGLSDRESEVLGLVARGESNKLIAARLVVGESTVKYHLRNILDKLHLENRAQVIAYAARRRIGGKGRDQAP